MSVHGRSFLQYLNEDDDLWYPLPVADLISVDYEDKVYLNEGSLENIFLKKTDFPSIWKL